MPKMNPQPDSYEGQKLCKKCGQWKSLFEFKYHIYRNRKSKKGYYSGQCNSCLKIQRKAQGAKYYKDNRDQIKIRHKRYYDKNQEQCRQRHHEWYLLNKESILYAKRCQYELDKTPFERRAKEYYQKNKPIFKNRAKIWKKAHRELVHQSDRRYECNHKNQIRHRKQKQRDDLQACYIRNLIKNTFCIETKLITPEMIEREREYLQVIRAVRAKERNGEHNGNTENAESIVGTGSRRAVKASGKKGAISLCA